MARTYRYEIVKRFKYNGIWLNPGDDFEPGQGEWDDILIENSRLIRRIEVKDSGAKAGANVKT